MTLEQISKSMYKQAVEEYGEEEARKIWAYAKDPITGYVSRNLNQCHALDGSIPCQRCGGFGYWKPGGSDREDEVLCVRCFDDWDALGSGLLDKHGYVWSKKKWHNAFMEFCSMKPKGGVGND